MRPIPEIITLCNLLSKTGKGEGRLRFVSLNLSIRGRASACIEIMKFIRPKFAVGMRAVLKPGFFSADRDQPLFLSHA